MNAEHVSVEGQKAQIPFIGNRPTPHPGVSRSWTPSQPVLKESHERRRKQKIIERTLEKISERGLCGFEPVKAYLGELYRRDCRPNTLRTHAVTIISFLLYLKGCGERRLEGISREDIGGYVEHAQDRGLKANSISVRLRGVYSFLKFLVHRGELSADVLTCKLRIKLPQSLPRAIEPQAVRQMLAVINHPWDRAIFLVLLRTGMRIGELLDTRLSDVDLCEQKIEIMEARKIRVGRVVYLSEDACAALRHWQVHRSEKSAYLFHGIGRLRLGYEAVRGRFERYLAQAGLSGSGYSLHSLQHTFASELLNAGMRLECLQQLLGHSCIEMTRRYARLTDTTRREEYFRAMAQIERGGDSMAIIDAVVNYRRWLKRRNCSPHTLRTYMNTLRHFVLWLALPIEAVGFRPTSSLCRRARGRIWRLSLLWTSFLRDFEGLRVNGEVCDNAAFWEKLPNCRSFRALSWAG